MDYSIDQLSRFIDRGVREKMERIVVTDDGDDKPVVAAPVGSPVDLRALLRGRFGAGAPGDAQAAPSGNGHA
jgi:hypothetical protein